MATLSFRDQIIQHIDRLTPDQQKQVLDFTATLARSGEPLPPGTPADVLTSFIGLISDEDLMHMELAIQDCDRVDPDDC